MVKAGVLYGDRVRLLSSRVSLVHAYLEMRADPQGDSRETQLEKLRKGFGWWYSRAEEPVPDPVVGYPVPNPVPDVVYQGALDRVIESLSWREIVELEEANLLEIQPLGRSNLGFHPGSLMGELIGGFAAAEREVPRPVALLDRLEAALLNAAYRAGALPTTTTPENLEAGLAAQLLGRLPAFPQASVSSIIRAREHARPALVAFRSAVMEFSAELTSLPGSKAFEQEVARLYRRRVEPQLEELSKLSQDGGFLRIVSDRVISSYSGALTKAAITLAATAGAGAPPLAQAITGAAVVAADVAAGVRAERRKVDEKRRANRLLWLYETGTALSRDPPASASPARG